MSRPEKPFVLLVDDNEATCTLVTAILHRDFAIEIARDGVEALERLKTGNYAALLLDLRMPQLDGFGVLDFMKAERPEMLGKTIVLSAALSARELARVKQYSICGVISKPFDVETLLGAVKTCVGGGSNPLGSVFSSGMLLLLADFLRQKWL